MNQQDLSIKVFKALGNPVRFKIMKFLCDGPKCVCKLNEEFEYSQANLSQHLRVLKDSGLVKSEKVGLEMHYQIYNDKIKDVIYNVEDYVKDFLNDIK
nr:metalloregulator ArsR/SmtB family transcription factor [Clostridium lundense]